MWRTNGCLRGVAVPAGEHRVVFAFESPARRAALLLSAASATAVALLGLFAAARSAPPGRTRDPGA